MRGRVFRNYYKGQMNRTKGGGWKQGREVGLTGMWGEWGGRETQTNVIEQQKIISKNK